MATKFLDKTGLSHFWSKIKTWALATFAAITHNQASNTINAMTGYSKPSSGSAIATSDSLNDAIGKLEAKVDTVTTPTIPDLSRTISGSGNAITDITVSGHAITATKGSTFLTSHQSLVGYAKLASPAFTGTPTAPTAAASTNNTQIATTAFVKSQGYLTSHQTLPTLSLTTSGSGNAITALSVSNHAITATKGTTFLTSHQDISGKVNKSGDTMTGSLTITNSNTLKLKHTGITRGTAPSASVWPFFVEFKDNADKTLGGLYYEYLADKTAHTHLMCYQGTTNANTWKSIGIGYNSSGNVYTWAPTPATSSNDTNIATTAFVKAQGYITSSGSITGSAAKLTTARSISAGNLEFQGSANFDGSGNINLNITQHRSIVTVGNTNNYPFHRIAYTAVETGNYIDRAITFFVGKEYISAGYGICRIILRTNNASGGNAAQCEVQWLARTSDIPVDAIQVGFNNTAKASYVDVFYKSSGTYNSVICRVISHASSRTEVGRGFTVVATSTEANSTTTSDPKTSVESYATIAAAGTKIRGKAYTSTITASDSGVAGSANSCTGNAATATTLHTARKINGVSFNGSADITVADSTKVAKTGDTMTGALSLKTNGGNAIRFYDTGATKGTAPSADRAHYIDFFDKNGKRMGYIGTWYLKNKAVKTSLVARKSNAAGDTTESEISIYVGADGTIVGLAPTPPAGSNTIDIATTAWVRARLGNGEFGMVPNGGGYAGRSNNVTYTAEANGFILAANNKYATCGVNTRLIVNGTNFWLQTSSYGSGSCVNDSTIVVPIKKGQQYRSENCNFMGFMAAG